MEEMLINLPIQMEFGEMVTTDNKTKCRIVLGDEGNGWIFHKDKNVYILGGGNQAPRY